MAEACINGPNLSKGALPRLLRADLNAPLASTFGSATPENPESSLHQRVDRFPDHRKQGGEDGVERAESGPGRGEYNDGEILGAALWQLHQGMTSQASAAGALPVWGRLNKAVWASGFNQPFCAKDAHCDRNLYRSARELLTQLVDAWVQTGEGAHALNKVLGAFARVGFFLVPDACIDGDATSVDKAFCAASGGEKAVQIGGDAIIDVFDEEVGDGEPHAGVISLEDDYVKADKAKPPRFRIWTGPRFRFAPKTTSAADKERGAAKIVGAGDDMVCNNNLFIEYRVEGSADWIAAVHDPSDPTLNALLDAVDESCYREVAMDAVEWGKIVDTKPTMVHYRLATWRSNTAGDFVDESYRDSTLPAMGQWNEGQPLPAARFFVNATGRP
jgi:hypothetical protein